MCDKSYCVSRCGWLLDIPLKTVTQESSNQSCVLPFWNLYDNKLVDLEVTSMNSLPWTHFHELSTQNIYRKCTLHWWRHHWIFGITLKVSGIPRETNLTSYKTQTIMHQALAELDWKKTSCDWGPSKHQLFAPMSITTGLWHPKSAFGGAQQVALQAMPPSRSSAPYRRLALVCLSLLVSLVTACE